MRKTNRKGLPKAKWFEVIRSILKEAGVDNPKIEFTPEGINVEWFTITYAEWEQETPSILNEKVIVRGYGLIEWKSTDYSYHEPPDVYDVEIGNFQSPYAIVAEIAKQIFNQKLGNVIEGFQMEDEAKEEEKYLESMVDHLEQKGKDLPESPAWAEDQYRDQCERHNRQVLSRL